MLFNDEYDGPRFTYGLTYRPLGYGTVPAGWLVGSDGQHRLYRHGTVSYPRELTAAECAAFQLTRVGEHATGGRRGRWVSPAQPGDWWTDEEAEDGRAPHDAYRREVGGC